MKHTRVLQILQLVADGKLVTFKVDVLARLSQVMRGTAGALRNISRAQTSGMN